jgi:PHD-zinc-finger like domain/SET domain/PHD-finger
MALPGSNRCERFAGWLDGDIPPSPPPLNTEEERKRLAYEAAACRLPEGVIGISAAMTQPGTCYVCFEEEEDEEDLILQCDGCGIFTHMNCYGVSEPPHGHLWLCDTCKVGAAFLPSCALCPIIGGALKRTDCGRWVHPSCVMWLPDNTYLDHGKTYYNLQGLVTGLSSVHPARRKLSCQICKMPHGACMQCCEPGCYAAFHIMCARQTEGYALQLLADSDSEEEEEEEEEETKKNNNGGDVWGKNEAEGGGGATALDATTTTTDADVTDIEALDASGDDLGVPSTSGSGDENRQVAANGASAAVDNNGGATADATTAGGGLDAECMGVEQINKPTTKKRGRPAAPPGTKKPKKKMKYKIVRGKRRAVAVEGTKINGARLVVYCPRHCPEGYIQPAIIHATTTTTAAAAGGVQEAKLAADLEQNKNKNASKQQQGCNGGVVAVDDVLARNGSGIGIGSGRSSAATDTLPSTLITKPSITGTNADRAYQSLLLRKNKMIIDEAILEKASAAVGGWPVPLTNNTTTNTSNTLPTYASRAMPFDGSLGRGPRAPEAMEAALAKRYYIEATPLLVRGPVPGLIDPPRSTCTWHCRTNNSNSTNSTFNNNFGTGNGTGGPILVNGVIGGAGGAVGGGKGGTNADGSTNDEYEVVLNSAKVLEPERVIQQIPGCAGNDEEDEEIEIMGGKEEKVGLTFTATATTVAAVVEAVTGVVANGDVPSITAAAAIANTIDSEQRKHEAPPLPPQEQQPQSIDAVDKKVNNIEEVEVDIMSKPADVIPISTTDTTTTFNTATIKKWTTIATATLSTTPSLVTTATAPKIMLNQKTVLSSSERYREMRATEGLRIAPGKSAIHGWGAFARLPHTKDQMVIEYVGDLVRPSVADARERQVYDSLVGAGTYVFRVNMDQCIDATQSGNLAHLLNHSCEPNCYSRTVPVWDGEKGAAVDHVVIFAAREIATWEELTYDYRFSGEEKLVCNCGAGKCRGMVNQASSGGPGGGVASKGTLVPKSKVKYPFRN